MKVDIIILMINFAEFLENAPITRADEVIRMLTLKQNQPPDYKMPMCFLCSIIMNTKKV